MGVAAGVCVLAWLLALCAYDIRERRLPNWLTLPGAVIIVATAMTHGRGVAALFGAVALFTVYAVVHLASPAVMGAGDVKLAIGVGALTGAFGSDIWVLSALIAPALTAGWGLVAFFRRSGTAVPHGPSMCVAAAAAASLAVLPV